jgi:hypothetical protein
MRAALGRQRKSNSEIVLGTFRSAATAWVAALLPDFGASDRFHAIKHAARMAGGAEDAGRSAAAFAAAAAHGAMMAAISVYGASTHRSVDDRRQDSARSAIQAAAIAAHGFMDAYDREAAERFAGARDPDWIRSRDLSAPERAVWEAVSDDLRWWEGGSRETQALLAQPLWIAPPTSYAQDDWKRLAARLLGRRDERWQVWVDWYEARLAGHVNVSEADEIARVSLTTEVWAQGPAVANASISRLAV